MDRCQWELFEYLNRWPYGAALGWLCDFVHQPCGKSEKAGGHYVLCIEMEPDSAWPRKCFGCWCALSHCTWCNGFGAMITSDSYTFWTFATWFCWHPVIPWRNQPWSAKVRVFWPTKHWWHSCILNFTTSLSSFFDFFVTCWVCWERANISGCGRFRLHFVCWSLMGNFVSHVLQAKVDGLCVEEI